VTRLYDFSANCMLIMLMVHLCRQEAKYKLYPQQ